MDTKISVSEAYAQALQLLGAQGAQKSQLGEAIELLNKIKETGHTSAQLEANLGRAYAKLENWPLSIEHFESAIALDRFNFTIRNDLLFAQNKIEGSLGTSIAHPAEWGHSIASFVRPQELFGASAVALWLFLFVCFKKRNLSVLSKVFGSIFVFGLFALSTFTLTGKNLGVMSSKTEEPLRSAPLENAEAVFQLKPGTRLRILRESGNFAEIERPNSFRGWIDKSSLRKLHY